MKCLVPAATAALLLLLMNLSNPAFADHMKLDYDSLAAHLQQKFADECKTTEDTTKGAKGIQCILQGRGGGFSPGVTVSLSASKDGSIGISYTAAVTDVSDLMLPISEFNENYHDTLALIDDWGGKSLGDVMPSVGDVVKHCFDKSELGKNAGNNCRSFENITGKTWLKLWGYEGGGYYGFQLIISVSKQN